MKQLHVVGAVNSIQKLYVVQRNRSKHLCKHKVDQLQGVISSVTIISTGTKNI